MPKAASKKRGRGGLTIFSLKPAFRRGILQCVCAFAIEVALAGWGFCQADHLQRALLLLSQGDLARADIEARQALKDPATEPQAWGILGTILLQDGKPGAGARDLERAIALNPRLVGARINLGEAYKAMGKPALAQKALRSALVLAPENSNARLDLAQLQIALNQYREALETALPVLGQMHQSSEGLMVLAAAYSGLHQSENLRGLAADWLALPAPLSGEALRFSELLRQAKLNKQAEQVLEKAKGSSQPDFPLVFELANVERTLGKFDAAEQNYLFALRLKPDCTLCDVNLAAMAEVQKNSEKALAYLIKARQLDPSDPDVLFEFGKVCLERDLVDDAVTALPKALALRPGQEQYEYVMASAYVAKDRYSEAASLLQQLLQKHPGDPELNYALGAVRYLQADYLQAETLLKKSIALQPHQLAAYYYLGLLYEKQRQDGQALAILGELVKRYPNHAPSYVTLGEVLLRQRNFPQAQAALDKAISLDPDSAEAHYQMAMLLGRMGEVPASKRQSDIARKLQAQARAKSGMNLHLLLPN
jgi:tetratricopeptide (TPR) repeat protein